MPEFDGKRFAIGKNAETLKVHALAPLSGIVDDSSNPAESWRGIPLLHASELPSGCSVINCSTSISPISAEKRIRSMPFPLEIVPFDQLQKALPTKLEPAFFVTEMNKEWEKNSKEWKKMRELLKDDESKNVFDDLVQFRLTGSYEHMSNYQVKLQSQYFDKVCLLRKGEVFVDCGGFDGDTTEEFINRCPKYGHVWFFEPSERNMLKAQGRLAKRRDIIFVQKGVSNQSELLRFNSEAGSASSISGQGQATIVMTTLDKEIPESFSFLKMDLEGWEQKALEGSRLHIQRDHPKLAVAVYHRASDFRTIPRQILGFRQDYSLYLRHYTEGWSETVMYFIPK